MKVDSWTDADQALRAIGRANRDIAMEEVAMNDAIEQVKRTSEEKVAPLETERKLIAKRLEAFVKAHYKELGTARSRELTYGTVGVKDFPPEVAFLKDQDEDSVAKLLLKKGYEQCVQVKRKVIKNAVKALNLSEEALSKLGLRLKQKKNQVYYTIDQDRIARER
jgi:phage host-nuclease inhibitor protein Gam